MESPSPPRLEHSRRHLLELVVWAIGAVSVAIMVVLPRPAGLLWENLFNAGHVTLSAVLALGCLRLSRSLLKNRLRGWFHYLVSLGLVTIIGGAVEVLQFLVPGTPSLTDLVRDLLGGAACLLVALSMDPKTLPWVARSAVVRWILRGAGVACFGSSLVPMLVSAGAAAHQWHSFPRLARFDSIWARQFVKVGDGALLSAEPPPIGFATAQGKLVAKVIFPANGAFPKLEVAGPLGDWSTYRSLVFEVYSPANMGISLMLRVHDRQHRQAYLDRFNTQVAIQPGPNSVAIPLQKIVTAPAGRRMDMAAITSIIVFASHPRQPLTLYFDDFRLER